MSIKSWVLGRVHRMNAVVGRSDLPQREHEPSFDAPRGGVPAHPAEPALSTAAHLGVYGALIAAVRDELEHFVASHIRLHLAIAERDRFLLTSIGVACAARRRRANCCTSSCASSSPSRSSATWRAK